MEQLATTSNQQFQGRRLHVIVQPYAAHHELREAQLVASLIRNLEHSAIGCVHVLLDDIDALQIVHKAVDRLGVSAWDRLAVQYTGQRLSYAFAFSYAAAVQQGTMAHVLAGSCAAGASSALFMLQNADISLAAHGAWNRLLSSDAIARNVVAALTRWDLTDSGRIFWVAKSYSQDAWVFNPAVSRVLSLPALDASHVTAVPRAGGAVSKPQPLPVEVIRHPTHFSLGMQACDEHLNAVLRSHGVTLVNPSLDLIIVHDHLTYSLPNGTSLHWRENSFQKLINGDKQSVKFNLL